MRAPAAPSEVALLESRMGAALPASFRRYLAMHDGMPSGAMDRHCITWSSVAAICEWSVRLSCSERLRGIWQFATILLVDSEGLGLVAGGRSELPDGAVVAGTGCRVRVLWPTFDDLLRTYLRDPWSLSDVPRDLPFGDG
jgi:hypothetical protein